MTNQVKIYVYGSCHFSEKINNDELVGNGGYGVVISINGKIVEELSGGLANTTNSRMDIIGITEGLKRVNDTSEIIVYLMNGNVIDTLTKGWLQNWKKNGFKKKIKNLDLWKSLDLILQKSTNPIRFIHAKEIKENQDFKYAEELGKNFSAKSILPVDVGKTEINLGMFHGFEQNHNRIGNPLSFEYDEPEPDGILVDAYYLDNPGKMEYRGIDMDGNILFENKYEEATNNIGEFLAIVHALALYKKNEKELKVIYSDSQIAISWVNNKICETKLEKNEKNEILFNHITRAIIWLNNNEYDTKVLKWKTSVWGEIPADYGRK